jgi:hypothetical protein
MQNPPSEQVSSQLEQRIEIIESLGDEELGEFTRFDWLLCVLGAVVIPAILLWWFA